MTEADIASFQKALLDEQKALLSDDVATEQDRGTVVLDQQSVGRLSRMDALQRQAMAQATQRRRNARITRLKAALQRIDDGEYGYCQDCGDDIERARLDLDPTVPNCVSCAKG